MTHFRYVFAPRLEMCAGSPAISLRRAARLPARRAGPTRRRTNGGTRITVVVSPAKAPDLGPAPPGLPATRLAPMAQTLEPMKIVRKLTRTELEGLMDLSENLAGFA